MSKCMPCSAASDFRHRISFQKKVITPDDMGGGVESWEEVAKGWAALMPRLGNERFFGQRVEENITHLIEMRYMKGLDASMRIVFEGRVFQIKSIISPEEKKEFLQILAIEGVGS